MDYVPGSSVGTNETQLLFGTMKVVIMLTCKILKVWKYSGIPYSFELAMVKCAAFLVKYRWRLV